MVSQYLDVTADFNVAGSAILDIGEFDWVTVQLVTPAGTVTFNSSNDGGAIQGVTDGNATSAINFIAVQGTNLNTGTAGTTLAASGLMRFAVVGRYLQLSGTTAAKVLVKLSKIE